MDVNRLNLGLIGAGRIGRLHAEHLAFRLHDARVFMVADVNEIAARQCAEQFNIAQVAKDYRAILENREIDAVLICSGSGSHAQIIEESADAGKHIFCEKPIGVRLDEIDRALAVVERAKVKLQIGFNRRFDANFARVRRAVAQGEIGEPHLLHIISRDPSPPPIEYYQFSGGLFLDTTIHDFDMARFLIGSEVNEIYCAALTRLDATISPARELDTAITLLKFDNGVIGTIDNSRQAVYGYDQRVEVFGSAGAISTNNNFPNTAQLSTASNIQRDLPLNFFMERYVESYLIELQAFIDAVKNDEPTPVNGYDGRVPVVMALAAQKSYGENRPVRLSEFDVK